MIKNNKIIIMSIAVIIIVFSLQKNVYANNLENSNELKVDNLVSYTDLGLNKEIQEARGIVIADSPMDFHTYKGSISKDNVVDADYNLKNSNLDSDDGQGLQFTHIRSRRHRSSHFSHGNYDNGYFVLVIIVLVIYVLYKRYKDASK